MVYHADYNSWTGWTKKIALSLFRDGMKSILPKKVQWHKKGCLKKILSEIGRLKIPLQGASWRKYKINLNQYAVSRKKFIISVDSLTDTTVPNCIVWQGVGSKYMLIRRGGSIISLRKIESLNNGNTRMTKPLDNH